MKQRPTMTHVAAIAADDDRVDAQALLARAAEMAHALDMRVAGVLAEHHGLPDRSCAAGTLRDIASGRGHTIYLPVAPSGTSCHLDPAGVEAACAEVLDRLEGVDLVILSKFGKLEAAGSGLFRAFEAAVAMGKPVLTSVSGRHRDAFCGFAPEAAFLAADEAAIMRWLRSTIAGPSAKAEGPARSFTRQPGPAG